MKLQGIVRATLIMLLMLAGCAEQPHHLDSMNAYCNTLHGFKTCTTEPIPSEDIERDAKRFAPRPNILTIYLVRADLNDRPGIVKISIDGRKSVTTLPHSLVRIAVASGEHKLELDDHGRTETLTLYGESGEVKFVRVTLKYGFTDYGYRMYLASGVEQKPRATNCKLVADVVVP